MFKYECKFCNSRSIEQLAAIRSTETKRPLIEPLTYGELVELEAKLGTSDYRNVPPGKILSHQRLRQIYGVLNLINPPYSLTTITEQQFPRLLEIEQASRSCVEDVYRNSPRSADDEEKLMQSIEPLSYLIVALIVAISISIVVTAAWGAGAYGVIATIVFIAIFLPVHRRFKWMRDEKNRILKERLSGGFNTWHFCYSCQKKTMPQKPASAAGYL